MTTKSFTVTVRLVLEALAGLADNRDVEYSYEPVGIMDGEDDQRDDGR